MDRETIEAYSILMDGCYLEMFDHLRRGRADVCHDDDCCRLVIAYDLAGWGQVEDVARIVDWDAYRLATGDYYRFARLAEKGPVGFEGCYAPCCTDPEEE